MDIIKKIRILCSKIFTKRVVEIEIAKIRPSSSIVDELKKLDSGLYLTEYRESIKDNK